MTRHGRTIHLLAGQFPPMIGGLADHTAILADGLAARGWDVHVWVPRGAAPRAGMTLHADFPEWSPTALRAMGTTLDGMGPRHRIVLQWVPHGFGYRSLNVALPLWILGRARRGDRIYPIVHEAALPFDLRRPLVAAGAIVHRFMAALLIRAAAELVWVSVPRWVGILRRARVLGGTRRFEWLPVPSNIVATDDAAAVAAVRARVAPAGESIVGTFGLHGGPSTPLAGAALARLLRVPGRQALVIGVDGTRVREAILRDAPDVADRIHVTGGLPGPEASAHIAACDVLLQPFIDGVSSRRGSAMAALMHRVPLVTTFGPSTEDVWREAAAARLVEVDVPALADATDALLRDPSERAALAARGAGAYEQHFSAERLVERVDAVLAGAPRETRAGATLASSAS